MCLKDRRWWECHDSLEAVVQIPRRVDHFRIGSVEDVDKTDVVMFAVLGAAGGKFLGEMDFDGIYADDVVDADADLAAILGSRGLPLRVGEGGGEGGCNGFQAGGEGFGSLQSERGDSPSTWLPSQLLLSCHFGPLPEAGLLV